MALLRYGSTAEQELPEAGFRGQRGGKRGAVVDAEVSDALHSEETMQQEMFAQKSISLSQLLTFCKKYMDTGKLSLDLATCGQVIQDVIIPETAIEACSYFDYVLGERKQPDCFVSHWLGLPFRELMLGVVQHASGGILKPEVLEKKAFGGSYLAEETREKTYWICMFAANYHKHVGQGHPLGNLETVEYILSHNQNFLMVLDKDLQTMSRAWCCFELYKADEHGINIHFGGHCDECFRGGEGVTDKYPGIRKCHTNEPSELDLLKSSVQYRAGGFEGFDDKLKALLSRGAFSIAWRAALKVGCTQASLESMQSLLKHGIDVDVPTNRMGDTALIWAAQFGMPSMVKLLLEHGASPETINLGGWTPLHYAAQLGAEASVRALLQGRANPDTASQGGRTALLEAAERGYVGVCETLLDCGADAEIADNEGNTAATFHDALDSEDLKTRLGWRPRKASFDPSPCPSPPP
mmetsp:Transcript_18912/g.52753  ORF Transcript_18912/g.52753 Transcript_18912/m.52753 type:complete len:467 (-) Transcript_18912:58-1458(-)